MTTSTNNVNANWLATLDVKKLRQKVLSRKAVVVYSCDLDQVLWANASGANLFGGGTIRQFMEQRFTSDHPFLRQLASAVRQLGDERIFRGFRVVDDTRSKLLQCEIGYYEFPLFGSPLNSEGKSTKAILLSCANPALEPMNEHEFSQLVLENFADFGKAHALCDQFGLSIAASDAFVALDLLPQELEKACRGKSYKTHRPIELADANEGTHQVKIYRVGGKPKRFLALLDEPNSPHEQIEPVPVDAHQPELVEAPSRKPAGSKGFVGGMVAGVAAATTVIFGQRKSETASSDERLILPGDEGERDENSDKDRATVEELTTSTDGEFVYSGNQDPVRFAWTTDINQVFTSVSDQLAQAVGPNAADIVGRKWSDVATVFGFDAKGEIRTLLQNQDTWSGKSVLWPIQGTDLQVPIDLAALPSFSRGKEFEGFRGFGIVRMLDTIVDPSETGQALVGVERETDDGDADGKELENRAGAQDTEGRDTERPDNSSNSDSDNIVQLGAHRGSREPGEEDLHLSNGEHRAFNEIGRKLRKLPRNKPGDKRSQILQPPGNEDGNSPTKAPIEVDTSLLAKLPIPVIVFRGNETLFANGELLALTGYDNLTQLREAGGIDVLFPQDDEENFEDNETLLNDKDGGQLRVKALLKSVPWDHERAMLMSFRQPKHEDLPQNEKIVLDMMQVSELQNILDTAADGIIVLAANGEIQSLNQSAEALFGVSDADKKQRPVQELFASESREIISKYLAEVDDPALRSKLNDGREVIGVEAKGGLIPLYVTIGKIGKSDKFCLVLRDMTPWKKSREELIDARKQAEDASNQKTEFLARVSHEIRTPLNAIIGFSDVMIEERFGPVDNERYREYLRDINRSGVHVLDLINDLLDISKIEAGKMELSFEAVDLNKIVAETVALMQPQANGNRVLIRTSLSRAVPNVVADARSIRQIVLNLVSNAIKFTPANGQVIVSTVYEGNGEVALRVRDTGRGMSDEEVVVAMKPFRQINSISETGGQGTGLGLPLTKALVEANKAYLDIESEPGEGTIVHIQFPSQRVLAD